MSGIGTGYDLSTTTYSPDGKVFQVDYACKAVDNGGLALGVRCKDGVVLGVEKLLAMKMLVNECGFGDGDNDHDDDAVIEEFMF